jgi:antitoxin HigA-1
MGNRQESVGSRDTAACRTAKAVALRAAGKFADLHIPAGNASAANVTAFASTICAASALCRSRMERTKLNFTDYHEREEERGWQMKNSRRVRIDRNIHPGEILREEFLKPFKVSRPEPAKRVRVPAPRLDDIVLEKRGISADPAVRLAKFFGIPEAFWMNLQAFYEVRGAKNRLGKIREEFSRAQRKPRRELWRT